METATLETKPLLKRACGPENSSFFNSKLPTLIVNMKQSQSWAQGGLNSMILLKTPSKKIVLTAVHKGTEITSFQSNDSISFQVIEGKLIFHTRRKSVCLNKGQFLTYNENSGYSLTTGEVTVFLLTILQTVR